MTDQKLHKRIGRAAIEAQILDGLLDPVILLDENRVVMDGNNAAFELIGADARGRDLDTLLDSRRILKAVNKVLAGKQSQPEEVSLRAPVFRTYEMRVLKLPGRKSGMSGWVMIVLHDISSAKMAEKMRADFVSNVSHELRSPLSSLLGFIETLQGSARDDPQAQTRFLAIMEGEARRMARLVNDLLTLSKVEADAHIRPEEAVDLYQVLREVADILSSRAGRRDMSIELAMAEPLPRVAGDRDELFQLFRNLIDNAINYGAEGTAIEIAAEFRGDEVAGNEGMLMVSVTNYGIGIQPKHLDRITERFYRIDKARSRSTGGTGLGLAIVKHIVQHHRGELAISSEPGDRTTFSVRLPTIE